MCLSMTTELEAKIAEMKKDQYVKQWLSGLSEATLKNYAVQIETWNTFIAMTPTEQIRKRMHDLATEDLAERQFFETKFREYKAFLEAQGKLSQISIKAHLRTVASFFGRTVGKLNLRRGDWNSTLSTRIQNKLSLKLDDIKRMYAHANLRDKCLLLVLSQSGFSEVDVSEFRIEDLKNIYETPISLHYFIEKAREKTGEIQSTCLSYEALHDIRDYLSERGNPKEGFLFTSQTKAKGIEGIEVRAIHLAMSNLAEKALGTEKAKEFKTKQLRSFYNSALLRADIKSEVKDLMMGHQRLGARGHYGYDEQTIIEAYSKAFEFLSINGMQSREDLVKIKEDMNKLIGSQQCEIAQLKELMGTQSTKLEGLTKDINTVSEALKLIIEDRKAEQKQQQKK